MPTAFALVDCNNFYASCEKLFRPDIRHRPVVVLSNNDGCVVARSKEAKALGIKMGVPVFKIRELIHQHRILTFSSNYALYADMSNRVMRTLEDLAPSVEIYSIDEAFLDLSDLACKDSLTHYGLKIRKTIQQYTGITVCVGIAPTKTLAKLANYAAKKYHATGGVVDLQNKQRRQKLMEIVPVEEIWGIGRRLAKRLHDLNIHTALDFSQRPAKEIRQHFSVVVERTQRELNGEPCFELEDAPPPKKQIVCSRSFGQRITQLQAMSEAIATYTTRATEKLRQEQQKAKVLTVFIRTSPFADNHLFYSNAAVGKLLFPSDDTRDFLPLAHGLLNRIWLQGHRYAKAGVMLSDFYTRDTAQLDLFTSTTQRKKSKELMATLDKINHSGLGQVHFASQGMNKPNITLLGLKGNHSWRMKRQQLSPAYTTRWQDIPTIK